MFSFEFVNKNFQKTVQFLMFTLFVLVHRKLRANKSRFVQEKSCSGRGRCADRYFGHRWSRGLRSYQRQLFPQWRRISLCFLNHWRRKFSSHTRIQVRRRNWWNNNFEIVRMYTTNFICVISGNKFWEWKTTRTFRFCWWETRATCRKKGKWV